MQCNPYVFRDSVVCQVMIIGNQSVVFLVQLVFI